MRKSLWIIPVLFATMVIPYAKADSISDANTATPLDPVTYKFKCCGGATGITDLDVVYSLVFRAIKILPSPSPC